ncbi:hypothetical protein ACET3Z_009433 [Daucus carota]
MFSSNPSSSSAFGSPFSFGQTTNSNASSTIPFGSMQGTPSSPIIWGSSSASMGSSANGFGSPVGFGQSINPNVSSTGSSGSQYTFGRSSNIFGTAPRSTTSSQVPASIASSSSRFGSGCMTSSGQTTVPWDTSLSSGTYTFSFGTQSSLSGEPLSNSSQSEDQVRAPIIGPLKTDNSSFWEKRGSRVTSYSKTTIKDDKGAQKLVSICAMPAYQNKSYDELRWEDHHLNAEGGGAFPAVIQSNDLRNPIARKDSTFLINQPVSISEPNKSSFISSLPTPTSPQYPSASSSSAASMLTEGTRTAPPLRYGISCMPVCDKPAPARSPSLLNIRHLTYHRKRSLPIQKYKPRSDGPKVAFFDDAQETPTSTRKEAPLLPRSNPKVFISGLYEDMKLRVNFNNTSFGNNSSTDTYKNGEVESSTPAPDQDGSVNQDKDGISSETDAAENIHNTNSVHGNHPIRNKISSNLYGLMPKLKNSDYYFEPRVEELATKESYEPGFISHVKGFVVGRQGYGSIKFLEETDVRELDLESYIEFRNREVIVYMDESKKPPVGQGLNKAAEITLCNIKVVDRKTGRQYVNGPNVDKFKEKLMKKTAQQGAEFVSYNPVQGEWKFRVLHF